MNNILTSEYKIFNSHLLNSYNYSNNLIKIIFKDNIIKKEYHSFGIHIVPNILFKSYNSLNKMEYILKFNYKLDKITNFMVYNGIKWILIKNDLLKGEIKININFNFKKYWRIRPFDITDFEISNIFIIFNNECKNFIKFNKKRKLLLIGGKDDLTTDFIDINKNKMNSFNDNNVYNFKKYFTNNNNITYNINCSQQESNLRFLEGLFIFDNCIDISQRGLYHKSEEFYKILRTKITGKICCICDNNFSNYPYGPQDYLLYAIPRKSNNKSHYIGIGVDEYLFFPNKTDKFTILIDDCYWLQNHQDKWKRDDTTIILNKCINFLKSNSNIQIIRLGYRDKQSRFIDPYKNKIDGYEVIEDFIPNEEKAKYHNNASIWWGTHPESLGMEYFESAMSGCILVYPKGFINYGLLNDFYRIEYDNIEDITLENLINMHEKYSDLQREKALKYTWNNVYSRINELFT